LKFLNNLSKSTTDVIGAIIAIIIFWVGVQYFVDFDVTQEYQEHNKTSIEIQEKKE